MFRLERRRARRRVAAWVQLILFLPGCTSWRVEPVAPSAVVSQKPPVVRVTLPDSSHLVLNDPVIRGDTLFGYRQKLNRALGEQPDGVPLSEVREIAVLRQDPGKTTVLGFGIAVTTFSALCLLADAFGCGDERADLVPGFLRTE
jgi:hypothetical protein